MLKKIVSIILGLLIMLCYSPVFAMENIFVYRVVMQNGSENIEGVKTAVFNKAKLSFTDGYLSLANELNSTENAEGKKFYALVPDGESFVFTYVQNSTTGQVSVGINDELVGSVNYESVKGLSKIPSSQWVITANGNETTSTTSSLVFSGAESFSAGSQAVSVNSCNTAGVTLSFLNPVNYQELLKISLYDENGTAIPISDLQKNSKEITVKSAELLQNGSSYTVCGENLEDLYGKLVTFSLSFTPDCDGNLTTGASVVIADENIQKAMGAEDQSLWRTESNLTGDNNFSESELLIGSGYSAQSHGAELVGQPKYQGMYSLKWDNHPYYSTLGTDEVPTDLIGANVISFWMYSEEATGETIMVTLYSDNNVTSWKDGYTYPLVIDWTGEKRVEIPLMEFSNFENPVGFQKIDGLYFHTKMYENVPNPYTVVYLDDIRYEYNPKYPVTVVTQRRETPYYTHRAEDFPYKTLNHSYPEVNEKVYSPIMPSLYYKAERAILGYYPKYAPGLPSFDTDGNTYIKYAGTHIQYLNANHEWQVIDLEPYLKEYLLSKKITTYEVIDGGFYEDEVIRFDTDGGVYVTVPLNIGSYLLYSPDSMKTWQVYQLPKYFSRFERIEGNNTAAMAEPPIILMHNYFQNATDQGGYLLIPQKNADGTLNLTHVVKFADTCVNFAVHSGDSNIAISWGNKVFMVYGVASSDVVGIPVDHPALSLQWNSNGNTFYSRNGIPTFIRCYDKSTATLSDPVFVGFGGGSIDGHNWPCLTVDSRGGLHVIINGHHNPTYYTASTNPLDITSWKDQQLILGQHSYASVVTDKNDTIYLVTRNSNRGYCFDLTMHRKKVGENWDQVSYIVKRPESYYWVWRNRISINPRTGELYLLYFSQSSDLEMYKDQYDAFLYTWPNLERPFLNQYFNGANNQIPIGTNKWLGSTPAKVKYLYSVPGCSGREPVVLMSDNGGNSFSLATTKDFINYEYFTAGNFTGFENFEGYKVGTVRPTPEGESSHPLLNTWNPVAGTNMEYRLVETTGADGNNTKALKYYNKNGGTSGVFQPLSGTGWDAPVAGEQYVYQAKLRSGGEEGDGYWGSANFGGVTLNLKTGTIDFSSHSGTTVQNAFPIGSWFEFTYILDKMTGNVRVLIDGDLVTEGCIPSYQLNPITFASPRWAQVYYVSGQTDAALYIDDIKIYKTATADSIYFKQINNSNGTLSIKLNSTKTTPQTVNVYVAFYKENLLEQAMKKTITVYGKDNELEFLLSETSAKVLKVLVWQDTEPMIKAEKINV